MSDLLNQASLVYIPSGYKEDTAYSVIPTDGSGDLTFTRASDGTRVNSQGLVERVPWNLLQQSNTFSTSPWSAINATLTSGQSGYDGSSNAWLITDNATSGSHLIRQTPSESGQLTISVYAKANTLNWLWLRGVQSSANVRAWFNLSTGTIGTVETNGTAKMQSVGNGWYRCSLTIANFQSGFEVYIATSSADNTEAYVGSGQSILIQNSQLETGSTAKPYFPTTDRLNVPRLNYSGGCPSLLLEPQRTNLVVQSNDMTTWTNGAGTMTKNATTSPDGTNNALSFDNTADCSTFVAALNGVYSWSLYVKQGTSATAEIDMSDGLTGDAYASFTFSSKTFSTTSSGSWSNLSTSYIECGNGWFRITLTATKNAGISIGYKIIATGSGYTYVYGAQVEAGSYPTSYIPTTSASVTRVADAAYKTGISSLIGVNQGSIFLDFDANGLATSGANYLFDLSDGSNFDSNRIAVYWTSVTHITLFYGYGGTYSGVTYTANYLTTKKIAVRWTSSQIQVVIDGVAQTAITYGNSSPTKLNLGSRFNDVELLDVNIKQCVLFNTTQSVSDLVALTS